MKRCVKLSEVHSRFYCRRGSVADVLVVGICIISMTIMMMAYLGSIQLLDYKSQISQISRKYILRMETVGYLTVNDQLSLSKELEELGAADLDFTGSTVNSVSYGSPIYLVIHGKITGMQLDMGGDLLQTVLGDAMYSFEDSRMSTAKN